MFVLFVSLTIKSTRMHINSHFLNLLPGNKSTFHNLLQFSSRCQAIVSCTIKVEETSYSLLQETFFSNISECSLCVYAPGMKHYTAQNLLTYRGNVWKCGWIRGTCGSTAITDYRRGYIGC
jgi:hypothetical protein